MFTNGGVRRKSIGNNGVGRIVVYPFPLGEGDNGEDIIVPFDDIICTLVRVLWEIGG